ncbi:Bud site selection protein, Revert to axial protein 1 [Microbotryomycetes sp. JL201]|nr:Bud site selection protein, Revert to axial protein 1 [Microbotryomycetes sp. JL201]
MSKRTPTVPRNRLPALAEVLRRSTRPPVDLYCFYLFLQREGSEDSLDFWLDVQQHENLCRAYFKDLRKSGRAIKDDWPRYYQYARTRGSIYGPVTGIRRGDGSSEYERFPRQDSPQTSEFAEKIDKESAVSLSVDRGEQSSGLARSQMRTPTPNSQLQPNRYPLSPTLRALYSHDDDDDATGQSSSRRRQSTAAQPYIMRDAAINRTDLIASAERIYSRYLMPGAEKEVYLPPALRVHDFPLSSAALPTVGHPEYEREAEAQARVPDMFHLQKEYVYRAMEQDSFPRFLRAKAFGNLTPISALVRLGVGLLALWIALATALSFIFLDLEPKSRRLWIILPFTFSIINIIAFCYDLDPLLVFMGLSETTPFRTIGIREPYVRKLLFGRALWVTFLTSMIVAILTVLFTLVPGHRFVTIVAAPVRFAAFAAGYLSVTWSRSSLPREQRQKEGATRMAARSMMRAVASHRPLLTECPAVVRAVGRARPQRSTTTSTRSLSTSTSNATQASTLRKSSALLYSSLLTTGLVSGLALSLFVPRPRIIQILYPDPTPVPHHVDSVQGKQEMSKLETELQTLDIVKKLRGEMIKVELTEQGQGTSTNVAQSLSTSSAPFSEKTAGVAAAATPQVNQAGADNDIPKWTESRPYAATPPGPHSLSGYTLRGPGKFAVPPLVFTSRDKRKAVFVVHLGSGLCGHEGIVHGGLLGTVLDESLGRTALIALPTNIGVTATLELSYKKPTFANQFVVIRTELVELKGRKAWVRGHIEDLDGQVLVEAKALFVEPRMARFLDNSSVREALK